MTSMILTSCQTHSVQCLQTVWPCCHCSANQTSAECCRKFTARGGYRMFPGLSGSAPFCCCWGGGGLFRVSFVKTGRGCIFAAQGPSFRVFIMDVMAEHPL